MMHTKASRFNRFRLFCIAVGILYLIGFIWVYFHHFKSAMWNGVWYGTWSEYVRTSINLIPFTSIRYYIWAPAHGLMNLDTAVINLFGNLILFLPMGVLLPAIFHKMRRFWRFLFVQLCTIVVLEVVQLLTALGSFDVDDILLNAAGAIVGWLIWRIASYVYHKLHGKRNAL